jgi:alpha-amylase/alpha-mannosidase (GH57 family)
MHDAMEHPLYIAIIWHMHQPYYRDMRTGQIRLPWVRLHASKDYLHMAQVLEQYPEVHLTINMVPSLTDQMLAWADGKEQDQLARLAGQSRWSEDEKRLILNLCFSISWDNVIRRYPRYSELLDRRLQALTNPSSFTTADYRDLMAWFNLAWIDPNWLEQDRVLAGLVAQRHGYSISDLQKIHAKQREIAAAVVPLYRRLSEHGQLEISASPYYHPILPLLIDTGSARRASPGLPLPSLNYRAAEDAAAQLQSAVLAHTHHFGSRPRGLWPSEGSVSFEMLPYVQAAGFDWLASGEAVLARSLGKSLDRDGSGMLQQPRLLYRPYRVMAGSDVGPWIVFRDHELSDRIGFLYHKLPGRQAAEDMIYRLLEVRNRLNDREHPYLVSIILDGENCWENFEHNGDVFLKAFYAMLSERKARNELSAVTVSEYLDQHPSGGTLARLATGSWIGGDLTTWIGDPEHNRAWNALARTRAYLVQQAGDNVPVLATDGGRPIAGFSSGDKDQSAAPADAGDQAAIEHGEAGPPCLPGKDGSQPDPQAAWRALFAAEGSDWFWWYSHRNRSDQDAIFDRLFRDNLGAVYEALGCEAPAWLETPISHALARASELASAGYVTPQLTGAPYPGEEWALAAALQPAEASSGTMQRAAGLIERLFVGHDQRSLYLRLDLRDDLATFTVEIYLGPGRDGPVNQRTRARDAQPGSDGFALGWLVALQPGQPAPFIYRADGHDQWQAIGPAAVGLGPRVLEVALPLSLFGLTVGQPVKVMLALTQHNVTAAQLPEQGMATFILQEF